MSTRRARIKAIANLPQRRKNINVNADTKKKQEVSELKTELKSPKPRPSNEEVEGTSLRTNFSSPRKSPRYVRRTPEPDKGSPKKCTTFIGASLVKPTLPVQQNDQASVKKLDVFASPRAPTSPFRLRSPVTKPPIKEFDVKKERFLTPHKRLIELQEVHQLTVLPENTDNVGSSKSIEKNTHESIEQKNIADGYNSPNTPEPDVMDGIVPLKQMSNAPKPIEILKNEIISENAEVVFDPIVPLPSPTKIRPKLRPVPRLGPIRRNSVPGSASESEDESRRGHHGPSTPGPARLRHDSQSSHSTMQSLPNRDITRVRNDSVCSIVSQAAPQTPALLGSPVKEKSVSKTRRQEVSRRMAALRRRKESIQRDKLTMYDLIFYNPLSNPIVPDKDEIQSNEKCKKEKGVDVKVEESKPSGSSAAPVPQIKLGPNGEIVLDEQSLVINQSDHRELSSTVVEDKEWVASGRVYRRTPRSADWTDAETVRFYRALAAIGTDFSLMEALFPGRKRRDLKRKFKKEEKLNMAQIDKALRSVSGWDVNRLQNEFDEERRLAEEKAKKDKEQFEIAKLAEKERLQAMKELKVRKSKGSMALESSIIPKADVTSRHCVTADDIINRHAAHKEQLRQERNKKRMESTKQLAAVKKEPKMPLPRLTPIQDKSQCKRAEGTNDLSEVRKGPKMSRLTPTLPEKQCQSPVVINALPAVPANIVPGSLVVLTVDDPKAPSQKAIHTYVKQGDGSIKSIVLDPNVMSSLVSLVKKDTPKAGSSISSPGASSRNSTPTNASPNKRMRLSSYTMTEL